MVQGCRARRAGLQNDDYEGKFKKNRPDATFWWTTGGGSSNVEM
jgi:hypothetical protein